MKTIFLILMLTFALIDLYVAGRAHSFRNQRAECMRCVLYGCTAVSVFYGLSLISENYTVISVASSLYFISNTFTMSAVLVYAYYYVSDKPAPKLTAPYRIFFIAGTVDVVSLLLNPLTEHAISYIPADSISGYIYNQKPFYVFHLIYCYAAIGCVLVLLTAKMFNVSYIYRRKYSNTVIGSILIIGLNGIFLFSGLAILDVSILFYSILAVFLYYNDFYYSSHTLVRRAQSMVMAGMGHPVLLFDNDNHIASRNADSDVLLPVTFNRDDFTLKQFLSAHSLSEEIADTKDNLSFYIDLPDGVHYNCNLHVLYDKRHALIGRTLVFSDRTLELDPLTRFPAPVLVHRHFSDKANTPAYPAAVIACDINRLTAINNTYGREAGDRAVSILANTLREVMPKDTYFARMDDALLLAVCPETDIFAARKLTEQIMTRFSENTELSFPLHAQCAISMMPVDNTDVFLAYVAARKGLRTRKMLDANSAHASLLASLAQTQTESDCDTEEHVQRTHRMGELLGYRLGLSDNAISDLSLLCLLHDIGKVGIPLEVLNKPDRLSREEWEVMRTHVEKGYRIAKASDELKPIADLILHHHESWDGSGYPDGLKGDAIPLLCRIIAVVDTYDAMTNDRPYRKALSRSVAIGELQKYAGTQFDPNIVSEFCRLLQDLYHDDSEDPVIEEADVSKPLGVAQEEPKASTSTISYVKYARYILDDQQYLIDCNDEFLQLSGYTREDLETYHLRQTDLIPAEDRDDYGTIVKQQLKNGHNVYLEHRFLRKDSGLVDVLCFGRVYYDPTSRKIRSEILCVDIRATRCSQRLAESARNAARRSLSRMEDIIRKDSLTDTFTHMAFQADVNLALLRGEKRALFMMADIDDFKRCNDTWGHSVGDELLIHLAQLLTDAVGEDGMVGRMGGDEFAAVVWFDLNEDPSHMLTRAKEIHAYLQTNMNEGEYAVTVSMGACLSTPGEISFANLYRHADEIMYGAKSSGKNRVNFDADEVEGRF